MSYEVDGFRIDSHKLVFHPRRVAQWLDGESIFPLYMEISPSGACNHRCTFCLMDHVGYQQRFPDTAVLKARIVEFAESGVRSILFGGEGEPLLNPDFAELAAHTRSTGIDVALSTNGVMLRPALAEIITPAMSWIKVSLNAGSAATYAAVHQTRAEDFHTVFANLKGAARFIEAERLPCVLGAQAVLLPENAGEMESLAERCRDAGLHYLVVKPHAQHHNSLTRRYEALEYAPYLSLAERFERFNDSRFRVIFRLHTMRKHCRSRRGYGRCLAMPFWAYLDSGGAVWGCSDYIGDDRFYFGNIHEESFRGLWLGKRREEAMAFVAEDLDPEQCSLNCRLDEINLYLWELTHPSAHVNFI